MFCKQNAYPPKLLEPKSVLQRIHTKPGTATRKLISKQDFLQPYFDCEFSDVHSSRIAQNIERYIKIAKKYQRETKIFVEAVLNKIYLLHKYNLKVAEVTFRYPLTPNFTQLLSRYLVLECSVLYKGEHHTRRYAATVEERILKLLQNVYNAYLQSLNSVPPEKLCKERCKAILNLLIRVKSEFEVQNDLMENIAEKLLIKMGRLEQVNALKGRCIPCPSDTFLSDPAVVNTCRNIITSDYGTDDNLKIEEEVIQLDAQTENKTNSNQEWDVRRDINEILNDSPEATTTNRRVEETALPYLDGEQGLALLEEEINSNTKPTKRKPSIEGNRTGSRERRCEIFLTHKPFHDEKPYVKDEVIDLISDDESGMPENIENKSGISKPLEEDEIIVLDDENPNLVESNERLIEEEILELDSDDDESFNIIPKEEEEELLRDETDEVEHSNNKAIKETEETFTSNLHPIREEKNVATEEEQSLIDLEKTILNTENEISECEVNPTGTVDGKRPIDCNQQSAFLDLEETEEKEIKPADLSQENRNSECTEDNSGSNPDVTVGASEELTVIEQVEGDSTKKELVNEVGHCTEPKICLVNVPGQSLIEENCDGSQTEKGLVEDKNIDGKLTENPTLQMEEEKAESRSMGSENLLEVEEEKLEESQENVQQTENRDTEMDKAEEIVKDVPGIEDAEKTLTLSPEEGGLNKEPVVSDEVIREEISILSAGDVDEKETLALSQEVEESSKGEKTSAKAVEDPEEKETSLPLVEKLPKEEPVKSNGEQISIDKIVADEETLTLPPEVENLSEKKPLTASSAEAAASDEEQINIEQIVEKIEELLQGENNNKKRPMNIGKMIDDIVEAQTDSNKGTTESVHTASNPTPSVTSGNIVSNTDLTSNANRGITNSDKENVVPVMSHEPIIDGADTSLLASKKEETVQQITDDGTTADACSSEEAATVMDLSVAKRDSGAVQALEEIVEESIEEEITENPKNNASELDRWEENGISEECTAVQALEETVEDSEMDRWGENGISEECSAVQTLEETVEESIKEENPENPKNDTSEVNGWKENGISEDCSEVQALEEIVEDSEKDRWGENGISEECSAVKALEETVEESIHEEIIENSGNLENDTSEKDWWEKNVISEDCSAVQALKETVEESIEEEITETAQNDTLKVDKCEENGISEDCSAVQALEETVEESIEEEITETAQNDTLKVDKWEENGISEDCSAVQALEETVEESIEEEITETAQNDTLKEDKWEENGISEDCSAVQALEETVEESIQEEIIENSVNLENDLSEKDRWGKNGISEDCSVVQPLEETVEESIEEEITETAENDTFEMDRWGENGISEACSEVQALEEIVEDSEKDRWGKNGISEDCSAVQAFEETVEESTEEEIKENPKNNTSDMNGWEENGVSEDCSAVEALEETIEESIEEEITETDENDTLEMDRWKETGISEEFSAVQVLEETVEESTEGKIAGNPSDMDRRAGNEIFGETSLPGTLETEEKQRPAEQIGEETVKDAVETVQEDAEIPVEACESKETFQFCNMEQEIEVTTEDMEYFHLMEPEEVSKEKIAEEEEIVTRFEVIPENAYESTQFEPVKGAEQNAEEICYSESDLHVQEEEVVTDTLEFGISEEIIINENGPEEAAADGERPKTNDISLEKNEIPQHLEICDLPSENTSLDILATVASEVSRHDSLIRKETKKTKKTPTVRKKKQPNAKNKLENAQKPHNTKIKETPDAGNKRVTRSTQKKSRTEFYQGSKCKPHDFVITNSSGAPPPSNNIYTQKLSEIPLTSEDSNDSEGNLQIDEDEDLKTGEKLICYNENTMDEDLVFLYESRMKGTVLISIPDTCHGNFDFLTQIEQLDNYQERPNESTVVNADVDGQTSTLKKTNHKTIKTKAEKKIYDKNSMDPYVSIERLHVSPKRGDKTEDNLLKNTRTVVKQPKLKRDGTDKRKPTKKLEDSDDDVPLLQRTQPDCKQLKKLGELKKEKIRRKINANKTKSQKNTKADKEEKVSSASCLSSNVVSTLEKDGSEDKNLTPQTLETGECRNQSYEEAVKSSNAKYYATPKLRRKSAFKHNLNKTEKSNDTKRVIYSSDKKYYTPPKLRRKSKAEAKITLENSESTPSQIEILPKCKNTISPTTEKLKKKLEINFKFEDGLNLPKIESGLPQNNLISNVNVPEDVSNEEQGAKYDKPSSETLEEKINELSTSNASEEDLKQTEICKTETTKVNTPEELLDVEKAVIENDTTINDVDIDTFPVPNSSEDTSIGINSPVKETIEAELNEQKFKEETEPHPQRVSFEILPEKEVELNRDIEILHKSEVIVQSTINLVEKQIKTTSIRKFNRKINDLTKLSRRNEQIKKHKQRYKSLKKAYKNRIAQSRRKIIKEKTVYTETKPKVIKLDTLKDESMEVIKPEKVSLEEPKNQEQKEPNSNFSVQAKEDTDKEQMVTEDLKVAEEADKNPQVNTEPPALEETFLSADETEESNPKTESTTENIQNVELQNDPLTELPTTEEVEEEETNDDEFKLVLPKVSSDSAPPEISDKNQHDILKETATSTVDNADTVSIEPKFDILESSDTTPHICAEVNQDGQPTEDKKQNEPSLIVEQTKPEELTTEDKKNDIDLSQVDLCKLDPTVTETPNGTPMETPTTVASEEVVLSDGCRSNTELNWNEHDEKIILETLEFLIQKVTESAETSPNENVPLGNLESTQNEELDTESRVDESDQIPIEPDLEISVSFDQESDNNFQLDSMENINIAPPEPDNSLITVSNGKEPESGDAHGVSESENNDVASNLKENNEEEEKEEINSNNETTLDKESNIDPSVNGQLVKAVENESLLPKAVINEDELVEKNLETAEGTDQRLTKEIAEEKNSGSLTDVKTVEDFVEVTETEIEPPQPVELVEEDKLKNEEQLPDLNEDPAKLGLPGPKEEMTGIENESPLKIEDPINYKTYPPSNKRKRKNPSLETSPEKKSKPLEIKIDTGTCDVNSTSPGVHSSLSASPKKKEKKSIESIINQLKEEKEIGVETNDETTKSSSSSLIVVDVGALKKKLLQKIKGHKDIEKAEVCGGKNKVSRLETSNIDVETKECDASSGSISTGVDSSCIPVEAECDVGADEEMNGAETVQNPLQEPEIVKGGIKSIKKSTVDEPAAVENDIIETEATVLTQSDIKEAHSSFEEIETIETNDIKNSFVTPVDFSAGVEMSNVFNNVENKSSINEITDKMLNIVEENVETGELPAAINTEVLLPINEIISECIPLTVVEQETKYDENPLVVPDQDPPKNLEKPFSNDCLEMSPKKSVTDSDSSCVEGFNSTNVETNLLNLCDLMLHVDSGGNVTRPSEAVCVLSNIISTSISSTTNSMSSTPINFTFPVASQADIKNQLVSMDDMDTKKSIFCDDGPGLSEKLPLPKNGSSSFLLNEQIGGGNPEALGSSRISLNLQEVNFGDIPIDSMQPFDLISSNSVIQGSTGKDFINEVTVGDEENDTAEARNCNAFDHNYTMEPLGGPLLSEGPEEEHIFSSTFNKNLVDLIRFPLNDNQLPSELSESDDAYKLNLDNEYAVKNLVMLGGQTSDINSFPLSNYNLSDIKRMNLIEDNISNSEDNSDSNSLVTSMEQESGDIPNSAWTQFIAGENANPPISTPQSDLLQPTVSFQDDPSAIKLGKTLEELKGTDLWTQFTTNEDLSCKVVVLPNDQYLASYFSIPQNDLIQSVLQSASVENEVIVEETPAKEQVKGVAKKSTELDSKFPLNKQKSTKPGLKRNEKTLDDDFLPKRRYSRTVLRAPLKKKSPNTGDNKVMQKSETDPSKTTSDEKLLLPSAEAIQKDSQTKLKDTSCTNLQNGSGIPLEEPKQTVPVETKETGSCLPRSLTDAHSNDSELIKSLAEEKPTQSLIDMTNKNSGVHCNIAELVKSRKRAVNNKYSSPLPAKELKSEPPKPKRLPEKFSPKTSVASDLILEQIDFHKPPKNPPDLLEKSINTPQHVSESHPEMDEMADMPQPCQKSNHSIENILNTESKLGPSGSPVRPVKNQGIKRASSSAIEDGTQNKQMKGGCVEVLNNENQKHPEPRKSENNFDKTFDSLVQQGNVNEAILLRVTEDNKLKTERKYNSTTRVGGKSWESKSNNSRISSPVVGSANKNLTTTKESKQPMATELKYLTKKEIGSSLTLMRGGKNWEQRIRDTNGSSPKRSLVIGVENPSNPVLKTKERGNSSKGWDADEIARREMERRSSSSVRSYGKSREANKPIKERMDRNSPFMKGPKEQREYKQHRSSFSREEYHQYYSGYSRGKERSNYPPSCQYNVRREGHNSDDPSSREYSRRREGHHSDDPLSRRYNGRRDGHHSDNSASRQHHFENGSGGLPRPSGSTHPTADRSSNVSASYYKKAHKDHGEEQPAHSDSRHGSGPYAKRGAILTQEKQEALLKALQDMVHKQLNSSGVKKSSAAEDYSWLDKFNEFNGSPQFSQSSSPQGKRK